VSTASKPEASLAAERRLRRLERRVEGYMAEQRLFPPDGRLLVAVSGGPDSTALLLVLARLALKRDLYIEAAHFDHQLRGKEPAAAERSAVEDLLHRCGVEGNFGSGDVAGLSRTSKLSIEEAARRARYDFLAKVARSRGFACVAAGHTEDDQAETVLMHILRGSGLSGIAGMAPLSRWPNAKMKGLNLVRPLLSLTRSETEAYCRDAGVTPVLDDTNRSLAHLRNEVRGAVLPYLRRYNPALNRALARLAAAARDDLSYIESQAAGAFERQGDAVVLKRRLVRGWPPSLRRHGLRLALMELVGDLQGFSERHVAALEKLAVGKEGGRRLDLARGVSAEVSPDRVVLSLGRAFVEPLPERPVELPVPGEVTFGRLRVLAGGQRLPKDEASAEVDAEALGMTLLVRRRKRGDRFQPAGMTGSKKLQDFFVDARVPRQERDVVPIFESERGIVWVGGLRIAEWAKPRPGKPAVTLSYAREG
jgi:tRNA(Ile)-lysidine synthase